MDDPTDRRRSDPRCQALRLSGLLSVFVLIGAVLLSPVTGRQSLFLLVLMIAPVMYAAFHFPRGVYLGMVAAGITAGYLSQQFSAPRVYRLSALDLAGLGLAVGLMAEMVHRLVGSRDAVEMELRESEARYRLFVTRFQGMACQYDLRGQLFFLHGAVEEMTGYPTEDFLAGKVSWFDLVMAEDLPAVALQQESLRTLPQHVSELNYRIRHRDGRVRWMHELAQNVCDPAGRPLSVLTAVYDVTGTNAAQNALRASERRFRGLFDTMQEGFALFQAVRNAEGEPEDFLVLEHNAAFARTFHIIDQQAVGKTLEEVFPELRSDWRQAFDAVLLSGQPLHKEGFSRRLGRHLEIRFYQPAPEQVVTITMDITERKQMEADLLESRSHFRSLFENSPIPLWDEDFSRIRQKVEELKAEGVSDFRAHLREHGDVLHEFVVALIVMDANRAALEMARAPSKEALRGNVSEAILSGHPNGLIEQIAAIAEGRTYLEWEGPNEMRAGEVRYHRITWAVAPGAEQSYARVIVAIDDITDTKRAIESLMYLSTHDTLTGLYNRAYFDTEIQRLGVGRNFPVAIVFGDMDGLKATNDRLGHAVGDELLRRAATVLRGAFRGEDVVARIGGDEFGVLLPGAGLEVARAAMQRVEAALLAHNAEQESGPQVRFSMGVAVAEKDDDLNAALRAADVDMYRVKAEKGLGR
jgi:diguanylate cyclase (GGDEF)-like protein/PAS domain S-box-containing protein